MDASEDGEDDCVFAPRCVYTTAAGKYLLSVCSVVRQSDTMNLKYLIYRVTKMGYVNSQDSLMFHLGI